MALRVSVGTSVKGGDLRTRGEGGIDHIVQDYGLLSARREFSLLAKGEKRGRKNQEG